MGHLVRGGGFGDDCGGGLLLSGGGFGFGSFEPEPLPPYPGHSVNEKVHIPRPASYNDPELRYREKIDAFINYRVGKRGGIVSSDCAKKRSISFQ